MRFICPENYGQGFSSSRTIQYKKLFYVKYLFGLLETQYLHLARERVNAGTSRIHGTQLIEKFVSFARLPKVQPSLTFLKLYKGRSTKPRINQPLGLLYTFSLVQKNSLEPPKYRSIQNNKNLFKSEIQINSISSI